MNRVMRCVIVLGAAASAAVPALAARADSPLSRYCGRQVAFVCGDSWANAENCMRYRADRLSERCQGEVRQLMAALEIQRRGNKAPAPQAPGASTQPQAPAAP
ncbi:MAG: hypothetical protein ACKO01_06235 [Erythrobacter sp.]